LTAFLARRAALALPVLAGLLIAAFLLIRLIPGDPTTLLLGIRATDEAQAALRAKFALDLPLTDQFLAFLRGAVVLDFGDSIVHRAPVTSILGTRIAVTGGLLLLAVLIALLIAVALGLVSALRRNRLPDHVIRLVSMVTFAMPAFWLALVLVMIFSLWLGIFPTSGLGRDPVDVPRRLFLPALTIGLYLAPVLLRTLRSSVIETLGHEFVEAARSRGLSERRVIGRHVLRNSLVTMVTLLGVNIGFLLSGAVVVENVFALPGLGSLLVSSIVARDYPVVQALVLVFGLLVILVNLVTDLAYARLDPRVRVT
jgi:peptide/nickel transport system permease protein